MAVTAAAGSPAGRAAGLSRHRDFRLFWIGQTTSTFGGAITAVALPLIAVAVLRSSTLEVALLQAAVWLPWLLIGLPAGAWVDRLPRRPVLITCDLVSLALYLSVPVAAWTGTLTIGHLLLVALLAGAAAVFSETAGQVYLPSLLGPGQLIEGNARLQGSAAAAHVVGPGAAGLLTHLFGAVTGLLADAGSFAVSAACLLTMRHREPQDREPQDREPFPTAAPPGRSIVRELAEGLRFLIHDPYLRVLALSGAAANLALTGYQAILVVFLIRENGVSPGAVGGIMAGMSAGGLVGAAVAGRISRRFGTARGVLICQFGAAPFALLIPLSWPGAGLALVVTGGIGVGMGVVAGSVIRGTFRQSYTPRHLLGRVVTGIHLLNYGAIPVGAVLGGVLGTALGLRPTMWIMAVLLVLTGGILLIGPIRRDRDLPAAATIPTDPAAATGTDRPVDHATGAGQAR